MAEPKLLFQQLFEPKSSTFTYLLADRFSREAILIDSVIDTVERDLKLIDELSLKLLFVLDTHIHADHVTAAGEIRNRLGIKTAVAKNANVACADLKLSEGDEINFGSLYLKVIETPGHTDASLSFYGEGMVFTGDALLVRGCGRTDFQNGSASQLFESVTLKLFRLPPETLVYPAHDYKGFTSSSVEAEMKSNPRLKIGRTKKEFEEIMANLELEKPRQIDIAVPANLACGSDGKQQNAIRIETSEQYMDEKKPNALLVDVRPPDEFEGDLGHISGAHQITLGENLRNFLEGYDRESEIIFVCRSGKRSLEAAKMAHALGFQSVASLDGGMQLWNEKGFPVERKVRA